MQCECCGREKEVLIEIGAVSPKVAATGRCCAECCAFILRALEDEREDVLARQGEILPVDESWLYYCTNRSGGGWLDWLIKLNLMLVTIIGCVLLVALIIVGFRVLYNTTKARVGDEDE